MLKKKKYELTVKIGYRSHDMAKCNDGVYECEPEYIIIVRLQRHGLINLLYSRDFEYWDEKTAKQSALIIRRKWDKLFKNKPPIMSDAKRFMHECDLLLLDEPHLAVLKFTHHVEVTKRIDPAEIYLFRV